MAASGLASIADAGAARAPPTVPARWALVLLGLAAAATSFTLALLSEDVSGTLGEPLLIAALTAWVTLSYVVCGLVAWWRRPANRFGPLLIIAGFVNFLSTLVWSSRDVLHTLGQALDLVPAGSLPARLSGISGWAAEGPVRAELRRDRVRRCDRTRARSDVAGDFGPHNSSRARKHQVKVSIADAQARLHGRYPSIGSASSRDARSTARATWIRDDTSSLRKMLRMCDSTVL